jgi:hypothetical protein
MPWTLGVKAELVMVKCTTRKYLWHVAGQMWPGLIMHFPVLEPKRDTPGQKSEGKREEEGNVARYLAEVPASVRGANRFCLRDEGHFHRADCC